MQHLSEMQEQAVGRQQAVTEGEAWKAKTAERRKMTKVTNDFPSWDTFQFTSWVIGTEQEMVGQNIYQSH